MSCSERYEVAREGGVSAYCGDFQNAYSSVRTLHLLLSEFRMLIVDFERWRRCHPTVSQPIILVVPMCVCVVGRTERAATSEYIADTTKH